MADDTYAELTVGLKQLSSLRVIDLKTELEKRGLPKSGSKKELLERLKRQLQLENLHQKSSQNEDHVPNLSLQDDALVSQNEVVKQYLAGQQKIYELQKEARRKIEQDDAYRASDTEASSSQDEGPSTKDAEQNQTENKMSDSKIVADASPPSATPNVKLKILRNSDKIKDKEVIDISDSENTSENVPEPVVDKTALPSEKSSEIVPSDPATVPGESTAESKPATEEDIKESKSSNVEEVSKAEVEEELTLKREAAEEVKDELALAVGSISMDRDVPLDLSEHATVRSEQSASPVFVDRAEMDRAALEAMEAAAILEKQIASSQDFATDLEVPTAGDTIVSSSDGVNVDETDKAVTSLGQESAESVDETAEACRSISQSFIQEESQNETEHAEPDRLVDVKSSQKEEDSDAMGRIRRSQTKAEAENAAIESPPQRKYSLREKHPTPGEQATVSDNIPEIPLPEEVSRDHGSDKVPKRSKPTASRSPSPESKPHNNSVKKEHSNSPERNGSPERMETESRDELAPGVIKREIRSPSRVQLRSPGSPGDNNVKPDTLVKSETSIIPDELPNEPILKVENPTELPSRDKENTPAVDEDQSAITAENVVKFEGPALPILTEKANLRGPSPSKFKDERRKSTSPSPSKSHGRSPKTARSKSRSPSPSRKKNRHSLKSNSKSPSPSKHPRRPRLKRGKKPDSRSPSPKRRERSSKRAKSRSASPPRRRDRSSRKKKSSRSPSPHRHRERSPRRRRSHSRSTSPSAKRRDKSPRHKKSKSRSQSPSNRKGRSPKWKSRTPSPPKSKLEPAETVDLKPTSPDPKVRDKNPDLEPAINENAKIEKDSPNQTKEEKRSLETVQLEHDERNSSSEKSDDEKEVEKVHVSNDDDAGNNLSSVSAIESGDTQKDILDLHPGDMDIGENPVRTSGNTNNEDDKNHKKTGFPSEQQHSHHPRNLSNRKLSLSGSRDSKDAAKEEEKPQRKRRWGSLAKTSKPTPSISTDSLKDLIPDFKPQLSTLPTLPEDFESPASPTALPSVAEDTDDKHDGPTDKKLQEEIEILKTEPSRVIQLERRRISSSSSGPSAPQPLPAVATVPAHKHSRPLEVDGKATISDGGRPQSPAKNPPSQILFIRNLVRPFTLPQLKEMLGRTGPLVPDAFWIDKIKSKCYVMYDNLEEAVNTRNVLHASRWPVSNPKTLIVDFSTEDELNFHKQLGDSPGLPPPPPVVPGHRADPQQRGEEHFPHSHRLAKNMTVVVSQDVLTATAVSGRPPTVRQHREESERGRNVGVTETSRLGRLVPPVREWDRDKLIQEVTPHGHRHHHHHHKEPGKGVKMGEGDPHLPPPGASERERKERASRREKKEISKKKVEEPPGKLLDDLFKKTKSIPCIYWLPLTDAALALREVEKKQWEVEREKRREKRQETGAPDIPSSGERRPPRHQREALKPLPPPMLTGGNVAPLKGRDFSSGRNQSPPGRRH